ncbi:MAG: DEAD/DEAH box helicase [Candidatus Competibacter sp.]
MELKPRQIEAYNAVNEHLTSGINKQLVALPTGVGKTVLGCHIANTFKSSLFLVHRKELIDQTARTMRAICPEIEIGEVANGIVNIKPFTIGMIQTAVNRLPKLDKNLFEMMIIDEAHHAMAKTWKQVAEHFDTRLRLGLSATPDRADGAPLANLFDKIVYQMSVAAAVKEGYLCQPRCFQYRTDVNISSVKNAAGDFRSNDLSRMVNTQKRNDLVLKCYMDKSIGRKALGFAVDIAHAKALATTFRDEGIRAEWVSGDDSDREEKIELFRRNEIQVLFNAMLLTEGFDMPDIETILMARPTQSKVLFTQMAGRGLRLFDGKDYCLIMDFVDLTNKHNLATSWALFDSKGCYPVGEMSDPFAEHNDRRGKIGRMFDAVESLFGEILSDKVIEKMIDILKPPPKPEIDYDRWSEGKYHEKATDKQLWRLRQAGYDVDETDWTKGQASRVISNLSAKAILTTKQWGLLLKKGYDISEEWTYNQALTALNS